MPHRIYAKPQSIESGHGDFALSIAADLLEGFEQYLGVNYSLSKMDQAAIPDFAAGAMVRIEQSFVLALLSTLISVTGKLGPSHLSRAVFIIQSRNSTHC